jgi:anti-sigma factor RsiW
LSTTTHPFAPEEIMAFVDGELFADRAQSLSVHLDQCAECSTLANELRSTSQGAAAWKVGTLPSIIEDKVHAAATATPASPGTSGTSLFQRAGLGTWKQWLVGFSAAAAVALLLLNTRSNMVQEKTVGDSLARLKETRKVQSVDTASTDSFNEQAKAAPQERIKEEEKETRTLDLATPLAQRQTAELRVALPMIARKVSLSIVAKDFVAARGSLDAILARHNGYAAELNVATPQGAGLTIQASLRIPALQLAAAVAELKALGRVESETQNGEEFTQQHTDLLARLKNSRETEQRLQDVLRTRTGKVKDVLEVEEEITRVRGEIEQMEAEQQALEHRVNFATIDLKLVEEYKAQLSSRAPSVGMQLRNATVIGCRNASESLLGVLLFFAESGPTLLLWLLLLLFPARLVWKRYQRQLAVN